MTVRVGAYAAIAVILINASLLLLYRIPGALPWIVVSDVAFYLAVGFFATRALRDLKAGLAALLIVVAIDCLINGTTTAVLADPAPAPGWIVLAELREFAINFALGAAAAAIAALLGKRAGP